ncbi:MAG: hypothetical protein R2783_02900 [Gelidibacter sp.]
MPPRTEACLSLTIIWTRQKILESKTKEAVYDDDGKDITYNYFEGYSDEKMIHIIKDYESFNFNISSKAKAYAILTRRSHIVMNLHLKVAVDENLISSTQKGKDVIDYSGFAFVFLSHWYQLC